MKQIFYILIILIVLTSCCNTSSNAAEATQTEKETISDFSIVKASQEDYLKAVKNYKDKLIADTTIIRKINGVLEIPLLDTHYPSSVIFTDTLIDTDELDMREYRYLGQYKDLGVFLVEGMFYEHYECYLIDRKSGQETTIWNVPKLSPSSKYFANLSMPYGYEGDPNGIQVWKIDISYEVDLNKYLELDQQIWAPIDFVWETDNSLLLKVVSIDEYEEENEKDYYYLRINL